MIKNYFRLFIISLTEYLKTAIIDLELFLANENLSKYLYEIE